MQAQHPTDKIFRDNLSDFEVVPSAALWGRIENALDNPGWPTVRIALAVAPVPPLADVTAFVVLVYTPAVALRTRTVTLHVAFGASDTPERMTPVSLRLSPPPPWSV